MKIFTNFAIFSLFLIQNILAEPQWYAAKDGKRFLIEAAYKYNWFQAWHECDRRNAQLITIDSEEKNYQIQFVLRDSFIFSPSHNLWIGGNNVIGERQDNLRPFYWAATRQEFSYTYWSENQPDNTLNKEKCVHISRHANPIYGWCVTSCLNNELGYICEERSIKDNLKKEEESDKVINLQDSGETFRNSQLFKGETVHEQTMLSEDLRSRDESAKELQIASENARKWKDIVKSSMRKTELDIILSLFKLKKTVFDEP